MSKQIMNETMIDLQLETGSLIAKYANGLTTDEIGVTMIATVVSMLLSVDGKEITERVLRVGCEYALGMSCTHIKKD